MSPILLRPVREQLQHDRVIQALAARWRRRFDVAVNVGNDQSTTVKVSGMMVSPDLVITAPRGARRLEGIVEVETGESVNNLEAMAQWAHFGKVRARFYLYVPAGTADVAQRLCVAHKIRFHEIWSYHAVGDTLRFTMVHRRPRRRPSVRPARASVTRSRSKTASKKTAARKMPTRKTGPKKNAARKIASKKAAARKSPPRKTAATRRPAKKTVTRKTVARKAARPRQASASRRTAAKTTRRPTAASGRGRTGVVKTKRARAVRRK